METTIIIAFGTRVENVCSDNSSLNGKRALEKASNVVICKYETDFPMCAALELKKEPEECHYKFVET